MAHVSSVHCVMGALLAFPAVAGYIMAVFVMAPLLISVTNAPVFEITPDKFRGATDSCLVELEVNKLHAEGRIELPGIGPVEEQALFVSHGGKYYAAPHLYAGLWELKLSEAQTAQLAGIFGSFEGQGAPFRYTTSPGGPYDGIPVRMLGRQNGRLIEVADIADSSGYFNSHLVTSFLDDVFMLGLCGVVACAMAGGWCLFSPASLRVFLLRLLMFFCLIIVPAGVLVSMGIVVHADEAPSWVGPLAVAGAVLGIAYSLFRLSKSAEPRPCA